MPQLYYDLLFCTTFLIVLLITAKYHRTVFNSDRSAFRAIIIGIFFLLGFSLVRLGGHQGLLSGIPYLSNETGRKVVEAFGIVAGLIFLLTGIGAWLPSLVKGRDGRRRLNKRYYCLKMISSSMERGENLDETYIQVMNCLSTYLGVERCAAYKYSSRRDLLSLAETTESEENRIDVSRQIPLTDTKIKNTLFGLRPIKSTDNLPLWGNSERPDLIVPFAYHNRLYGAFFFRIGRAFPVDDDLMDFMAVLGTMVGKHTHNHVANAQRDYYRTQQNTFEELGKTSNTVSSIGELIPKLFQMFTDLVGAEYLSVASLDNSGENMVRYTIGSGGRMLLEQGVNRQTQGTDVFAVFENGRPIIEADIKANDRSGEQNGLFLSCDMRSKLVCPVKAGEKTIGVLTLGHSWSGHFTGYHLHRVRQITDIIAGLMRREQLSLILETKEDHMLRLQLMQRQMVESPPTESFFNDACDLLTKRMKCTMARISLLDKDRNNLISQACRTIRKTGNDLRANESIPMSLLPWHRTALDAKKLMLINQEDPESHMPPQESTSALLPNIKSAMLVPIMLNQKVRGMISVGEARNWNRRAFGAGDLIFARDMAAKCSVALRMKQLEIGAEKNREELNQMLLSGGDVWPELCNRMKSPLTSIIGAVELLRMKCKPDEFSGKYYDLILKSAGRIKSMTEEDIADFATAEQIEPERVIG
jgi:transcriptional regulator with GAF, ATPase, and Fis domain